jgi:AraC-like DNA-binding protein
MDGAYALLYYDQTESMAAWIRSLPEGFGFSRELAAGKDTALQRNEALAALCAGFSYTLHSPLDKVQSYIALHYDEKLTLTGLADVISFSSAYLCDLFRKKCGIQLFSFIKQVRLGKACHLLRTTSLPINEVSRQVGYEDNSHFCREFKHAKGITPNAYRQAAELADSAES